LSLADFALPWVLLLLAVSPLVAWLSPRLGRAAGPLLLALCALAGAIMLRLWWTAPDRVFEEAWPWLPALGVDLAVRIDGLAATFVLLVAGIGGLVLLYGGDYLAGTPYRGRLLGLLLAFLAGMLGLVIADDLVTLFVFWEITSITSYLLIGTYFDSDTSRRAARQALVVTGAGGVALIVGMLILARIAMDSGVDPARALRVSALVTIDPRAHALYPAALLLILAGAFTKSAQVPFHFWLPAAMAAPTPVSALLHSATMVKAGVFLLARLHPALAGTPLWIGIVTSVGMITMVYAAVVALRQRDLKKILAWSTVAVLGALTMLLGIGTEKAIDAAIVFLVAHALYKAALFMVAGNIDHATGTRDISRLGGLRTVMPLTAIAGGLAALSKAGAPPMFGFVGKELLYKAKVSLDFAAAWLVVFAVVANIALVATALLTGVRPFFGKRHQTPHVPHEAPWGMLVGPLVLATMGIFVGLVPDFFDTTLGTATATAIVGSPVTMKLKLWHGVDPVALTVLLLSALTLGFGYVAFRARRRQAAATEGEATEKELRAGRVFDRGIEGLYAVAGALTARVHSGSLRRYLAITIGVSVSTLAFVLLRHGMPPIGAPGPRVEFAEITAVVLVIGGAIVTALAHSRLAAVAGLGAVGAGIAFLFLFFGAPDLAITQIMVETLTVILFVLVFHRMPAFVRRSDRAHRARDLSLAVAAGTVVSLAVLAALAPAPAPWVSDWQAAQSYPAALGRNVVNVILVDFRALDTLGETLVVGAAGLGVYVLLRSRRRERTPDKGNT
jgi:multicomponent Na+:H+ antiporter subunit A